MKTIRLTLASLVITCLTLSAYAGKKPSSDKPPTAAVNLTVVRDANGKPVKNAEVVLHMVEGGKQKDEGLELKTHDDGKAEASIPYGTWRIQVIAPGFKTYGEDFKVNQPSHDFTIKLMKPGDQVSIYK